MNDDGVARVAVYIDFDNIVISRYDQVNGRGHFQRDKVRGFSRDESRPMPTSRRESAAPPWTSAR